MMSDTKLSNPSRVPSHNLRRAVDEAWKQISTESDGVYFHVTDWGKERLETILQTASATIDPFVTESSLANRARDRVMATIASEAYKGVKEGNRSDELLFNMILDGMRGDLRLDSQSGRKESK